MPSDTTTVNPTLPPMLARMPDPGPVCHYTSRCGEPAVAETMMLWPQHQDENLTVLAETHMHPVCEKHLAYEQEFWSTAADGGMMVIRRLVASR